MSVHFNQNCVKIDLSIGVNRTAGSRTVARVQWTGSEHTDPQSSRGLEGVGIGSAGAVRARPRPLKWTRYFSGALTEPESFNCVTLICLMSPFNLRSAAFLPLCPPVNPPVNPPVKPPVNPPVCSSLQQRTVREAHPPSGHHGGRQRMDEASC